jgi:branched-chain amino acid transport system ATP-binding protein
MKSMPSDGIALRVVDVYKSFGGIEALRGVSIDVRRGEIFGIIGPNGAGKTVLLNVISGIYPPDKGEVYINSTRTDKLKTHELAGLGLVRTFQITRYFPDMTVYENLMTFINAFNKNILENEKREIVDEALRITELAGLRDSKAKSLSGGQKKLLEFARLVASRARLMLLDEPFAGVNPVIISKMVNILKMLVEKGSSIVVVSHEIGVVSRLCERVAVLDRGVKIAEGTLREVALVQEVRRAYLGI